jgi:amino acid adenylation domain-containing protein/thioester reductase-like protein
MFILQNAPMSDLDLTGLSVTSLPIENAISKFDLTLSMENTANGLVGVWEYNTDLFDGSTIERMTGHFVTLLAAVVENPQQQISQLPILTTFEQQQLLVEWNNTQAKYPHDKCIHELFEEQVKRTPDAVAVVFEAKQLTYNELNTRANQLAQYLQSLGVGADVLVGICVERSLEMVIGLLGILKAGGAYVPLDPEYPIERLNFMLEDAQVKVLLTQQHLVEKLPEHQGRVVCLDSDSHLLTQLNQDNLISEMQGHNLGYVIYTSGSTGKPKGVAMTHSALVNLIQWQIQNMTIPHGVTTLQFAPVSFDVSFQEMFSTWGSGGTLLLISEELRREPSALLSLLEQQAVARLFVPFVGLQQLAEVAVASGSVNTHLREIITAGEQLQMTPAICNWLSQLTNCTLHNHYGPSESHVVTTFTLNRTANSWPLLPPIGRPIANTQIYILDQYLQPVPVGVPGELYIAGVCLARDYFHRPELTQQKFIPNPFDDSNGQNPRLYKTGDLARYLPDGNIEYLGRVDNQVKIRGFRIELGEIESALSQYSGIKDTAVIARENVAGDKQLVAYVVLHQEETPKISDLRHFLKQRMPDYMIPAAFVVLETLPLTPSGKVNRRALPAPDLQIGREESFVAPRTSIEEMLTSIWTKSLKIDKIGVHDNFFELGGHSIKAAQVMSQVRKTLKIELPLRSLFEHPTVAELAVIIAAKLTNSATIVSKKQQDLQAEAVLDPTIQPHLVSFTYTREPNRIFLTGASGFLGAYLLSELLEQTQAEVYCLVRAADEQQAQQRLQTQMESCQIWQDVFSSRIIPVVGDLSKKLLGLSPSQFEDLANKIDIIYHNGAWVSTVYSYSTLKAANVFGTQEILRLASEIKLKPVHFISTIGVFASRAYFQMKIISESDSLEDGKDIYNGYAASKWVGEKLVMSAGDRGLPISIYRCARILGHSQTGISNADDFLSKLIPGCIQLGMVPKFSNWEAQNIVPVDYVSRAVIHLSQQQESLGKAFHVAHSHSTPLHDIFNLIRDLGHPLEEVSYQQWRSHLTHINQVSTNDILIALMAIFPEEDIEITNKGKGPELDLSNTLAGLAGTDIVFPTIEKGLIQKYLSYFIMKGLVPKLNF